MATEARPAFLAITGLFEVEALDAALRFAAALREASGYSETDPNLAACSRLAARAFSGDAHAWAPLVRAVRDLLIVIPAQGGGANRSRRELRAFVAENADLLDHLPAAECESDGRGNAASRGPRRVSPEPVPPER